MLLAVRTPFKTRTRTCFTPPEQRLPLAILQAPSGKPLAEQPLTGVPSRSCAPLAVLLSLRDPAPHGPRTYSLTDQRLLFTNQRPTNHCPAEQHLTDQHQMTKACSHKKYSDKQRRKSAMKLIVSCLCCYSHPIPLSLNLFYKPQSSSPATSRSTCTKGIRENTYAKP